jgi:hypothetical protein
VELGLGITREEVEAVVKDPQHIVIEDDISVAQARRGKGLLRVPFADVAGTISYDENENPVSIEFLNASKRQLFNPSETVLQVLRDPLKNKSPT